MSRHLPSLNMGIVENRQQYTIKNVDYKTYDVTNCSDAKPAEYYLPNTKPTNGFKFLYYCCFVFLSALLVLQVTKTVTRYLEKPTYTSSHLVRQYHAEFPALSICDKSRGFKEEILKVIKRQFLH